MTYRELLEMVKSSSLRAPRPRPWRLRQLSPKQIEELINNVDTTDRWINEP